MNIAKQIVLIDVQVETNTNKFLEQKIHLILKYSNY